jgi:hypothetical protein
MGDRSASKPRIETGKIKTLLTILFSSQFSSAVVILLAQGGSADPDEVDTVR